MFMISMQDAVAWGASREQWTFTIDLIQQNETYATDAMIQKVETIFEMLLALNKIFGPQVEIVKYYAGCQSNSRAPKMRSSFHNAPEGFIFNVHSGLLHGNAIELKDASSMNYEWGSLAGTAAIFTGEYVNG